MNPDANDGASKPCDRSGGHMSRQYFPYFMLFLAATIGLRTGNPAAALDVSVDQTASIGGHVADPTGQPLPGVSVMTIAETGGISSRATSGRDGAYHFDTLPDGTYRVDFELLGFDLIRRNSVRVRHDATAAADATLRVSTVCECIDIVPLTALRQRTGQVVDESGWPLAHARLEVVSPMRREVRYADGEGRFAVRVPVNETWPLTASDTGFAAATQSVSGIVAGGILFRLARAGTTGPPDTERFPRGCRCPGDLFTHLGR